MCNNKNERKGIKSMKKRSLYFMTIVFVLTMVFNFGFSPITVSAKTTSKNWYKKVLKKDSWTYTVKKFYAYSPNKKSEKVIVHRGDFSEYATLDINKDGTKELLFRDRPGESTILILTYYKKKVRPLYLFGYVRGIDYKGKTITYTAGTSSENTAWTFKLKRGKLKNIFKGFHTTSTAYPVPIYEINDKNVSRDKFYKKYNKYMGNSKSLDMEFIPID